MKRVIPTYKNLVDIIQDAADQESDAAQYYREAAELAEDQELRKFLLDLADMEDDHHRMLVEKLEQLKAEKTVMDGILSSYGDSEEEEDEKHTDSAI
ncbi:MAG: hypothetical protein CL946_11095 [Ectothiorhodospiraceae bacterium]|nr:hypothetical protein [Ectothiorhodospiraceae bacterium]